MKFDKNILIDLYINKGYTTRDCAKELMTTQSTVRRALKRLGIKLRTDKEARNTEHFLAKKQRIINQGVATAKKNYIEKGISKEVYCPWCGKLFYTTCKKSAKFCSQECYKNYLEKKTLFTALNPHKCKICGKTIYGRYTKCSDCDYQHRVYMASKLRNKVQTFCAWCGNELYVIPSKVNKHKNVYCNANCMAKYYAENYIGENSPSWKGGKKHYTGYWYRQRDLVRKRDNYTCQLCGITEAEWHKQLDVHHIVNYRLFTDKTLANNIDNLVCLCNKCHSFIHSNSNNEKLFIKDKI